MRQITDYERGAADERERIKALISELSASDQDHKDFESYGDGWKDACNEILWATESTIDGG